MSRIDAAFARARAEGRPALVAFLTVGYPNLRATPALVQALARGGADMVELGIPFSDPWPTASPSSGRASRLSSRG